MTPIFFPSTWIPKSLRGLLFACFRQVTVLQPARELVPEPLRRLEESGRLNICLPDEEVDGGTVEDLPNLLRGYHAWADLHQGEHPDFHKFARHYASDRQDASTAWIRSKIRNPEQTDTAGKDFPNDGEADPLQMARLFLAIAQEHEQQDEALFRDLQAIDNMERRLLQNLSPDRLSPAEISAAAPSPAELVTGYPMPAQRLAAWRRLYAHCRQRLSMPTPAAFYVTGDQEALRLVLESADTPEMVCRITGIPFRAEDEPSVGTAVHRRIDDVLRGAVQGGALSSASSISFSGNKDCPDAAGMLIIYRVKGNPLAEAISDPASAMKPAAAIQAGGGAPDTPPFIFIGHILENCTLDSSK